MPEFPTSPVPPAEFMEEFLPRAFAESEELKQQVQGVETRLGVRLDGEGGGEWVVHVKDGDVRIEPGSREKAAFTVVQSVDDWRGALWEGRGGAIGKQASAVFRPGAQPAAAGPGAMGPPSPAALAQMESLNGLMKMVVTGGAGGDWSVAFKLGPGEIPAEPTTTITMTSEDAAAMESGALNPMEAFMAGRIQVAGDMSLMMQMQAIQMQAQMQAQQASGGGGGSGGGSTA